MATNGLRGLTRLDTLLLVLLGIPAALADEDSKAFAAAKNGCDAGKAVACQKVADMVFLGQGTTTDKTVMAQYTRKACDLGLGYSCTRLARTYRYAHDYQASRDAARVTGTLQQGCDRGDAFACGYLATIFEWGLWVSPDPARAKTLREQGCDELSACFREGLLSQYGLGVPKDPAHATTFFARACSEGCNSEFEDFAPPKAAPKDVAAAAKKLQQKCGEGTSPHACTALAALYEFGGGVPKDPARAAALYEKASDLDRYARAALGDLYATGTGVPKDPSRAAELYAGDASFEFLESARGLALLKNACDTGNPHACGKLGELLGHSSPDTGLPKDPKRVSSLFKMACDGGVPTACSSLADVSSNTTPQGATANLALYKKACDRGSGEGCSNLAEVYGNGLLGLPRDVARSYALYKQACDQRSPVGCMRLGSGEGSLVSLRTQACNLGVAVGCYELGVLYASGLGIPRDEAHAAGLFKQACEAGSKDGCASVLKLQKAGVTPPKNTPPVTKFKGEAEFKNAVVLNGLKQACAMGVAEECNRLGERWIASKGDPAEATGFFRQACAASSVPACTRLCGSGDVASCEALGDLYVSGTGSGAEPGDGAPKDVAQGAALYQKACTASRSSACGKLAGLYEEGKGVAKDQARALALYGQACDGGEALECVRLGLYYVTGEGVPRDYPRSNAYNKKACDSSTDTLGAGFGCYALGLQYERGVGVSKDPAKAAALYAKACDGENHGDPCFRLGLLYEHGSGVQKNPARAAELYKKSCDGGSKEGCEHVKH